MTIKITPEIEFNINEIRRLTGFVINQRLIEGIELFKSLNDKGEFESAKQALYTCAERSIFAKNRIANVLEDFVVRGINVDLVLQERYGGYTLQDLKDEITPNVILAESIIALYPGITRVDVDKLIVPVKPILLNNNTTKRL